MRTAEVIPLVPAWRVDRAFTYAVPDDLVPTVEVGSLVRIGFGNRKVRGVVIALGERADPSEDEGALEPILKVMFPAPVAPDEMPAVIDLLARRYVTQRGVAFDRVVPPRVRVTARVPEVTQADGLVARLGMYDGGEELLAAVAEGRPGAWLIQRAPTDDPGELVAELVAPVIAGSGSALVLVPEVRYGSEVADALAHTFPGSLRVDSAAGDQERSKAWAAMGAGAKLAVGGRSAILTPARDLKLVVVDDESHPSYKEDRTPRLDARRIAIERARLAGAAVVFISEAPSVESTHAAMRTDMRWVGPSREVARAARPNVELTEPGEMGLSDHLRRAIKEKLTQGERVGLLVPRAGYARALWCADCKRSVRCPTCEAGVIYDRASRSYRCPRCTRIGRAPEMCPTCRSTQLRSVGAGVERLEEQLARAYPRATVRRMDPGVLAGTEEAPQLDDVDIYVTTWIGTKPVLRPSVSLVGVLDADALIRRPDFRAAESAYQALVEMASWAGPASNGGRLVVQTNEPSHHSIQAVARGDHMYFVERELPAREELGYPPYSELIKVRAEGDEAATLLEACRTVGHEHEAVVLGPIAVQTPHGPVQELLLKCSAAQPVAEALRVILPGVARGSSLRIDVDPR